MISSAFETSAVSVVDITREGRVNAAFPVAGTTDSEVKAGMIDGLPVNIAVEFGDINSFMQVNHLQSMSYQEKVNTAAV